MFFVLFVTFETSWIAIVFYQYKNVFKLTEII